VEFTWKGLFQRRLVLAARHCDRVHGLLFGAIDVVDADVRNWSRNEGPAAGIATRVHDGLEGARGHLRAAVYALLTALDGVGVGGGGEGGDSTAPWEHSPCFAEQLNGAMEPRQPVDGAWRVLCGDRGARPPPCWTRTWPSRWTRPRACPPRA